MPYWCVCGRTDAFGRTHTCRHPDGPRWSDVNPHVVTQAVVTRLVVTQSPPAVVTQRGSGSTERGKRWLAANRERRNAYMRDYRKRKKQG